MSAFGGKADIIVGKADIEQLQGFPIFKMSFADAAISGTREDEG